MLCGWWVQVTMVVQVQAQAQVNVEAFREVGCAFGCCRSMEERLHCTDI